MNKGIRLAQSEVVAILNSDDRWLPGTLELVEKTFMNSPDVGIVHGDIDYVIDQSTTLRIKPTTGFWRSFGLGLPTAHPAAFIRREVYTQHGLYDSDRFPIAADQELVYRAFARGVTDRYLGEVLTLMAASGQSSRLDCSAEIDNMLENLDPRTRWIAKRIRQLLNHDNRFYDGRVSSGFGKEILLRLLAPGPFKRTYDRLFRRSKARDYP
jgi:hypothetical protein